MSCAVDASVNEGGKIDSDRGAKADLIFCVSTPLTVERWNDPRVNKSPKPFNKTETPGAEKEIPTPFAARGILSAAAPYPRNVVKRVAAAAGKTLFLSEKTVKNGLLGGLQKAVWRRDGPANKFSGLLTFCRLSPVPSQRLKG